MLHSSRKCRCCIFSLFFLSFVFALVFIVSLQYFSSLLSHRSLGVPGSSFLVVIKFCRNNFITIARKLPPPLYRPARTLPGQEWTHCSEYWNKKTFHTFHFTFRGLNFCWRTLFSDKVSLIHLVGKIYWIKSQAGWAYLVMAPLVHPSEIWVRELRSKSTWAMWPPLDMIISFHRQYR